MIGVDLAAYWTHAGRPAYPDRAGIRIMQWSNYVRKRLGPPLNAVQEFDLLAEDERTMGSADWWR